MLFTHIKTNGINRPPTCGNTKYNGNFYHQKMRLRLSAVTFVFHHLTLTTHALLSTRKITILSRRGPAENPNQGTISQLCWASHNTYRCAKREGTKPWGKKPESPDSASQQKQSSCEAQKCFDHRVDVVITVCKCERWKSFQMFLSSLQMTLITLFSFQFLCC